MESNNKETEKKSFEFKRRHIIYIIIGTVVVSIVGALIINLLYSLGKNGNAIYTEWQASDTLMFFATVLEALGTISLGAISIWQNVQLQKANEQSQKRLEKISLHANEISLINLVVERENSRINRFIEISEEFIDCVLFIENSRQNPINDSKDIKMNMSRVNVYRISQKLICELSADVVNHKNATKLITLTKTLSSTSDTVYDKIQSKSLDEIEKYKDQLTNEVSEYMFEKNKYVGVTQLWINKLMLGDFDLNALRRIYHTEISNESVEENHE